MKFWCTLLLVSAVTFAASAFSQATPQVATGTPPFASLGGGPFDVINLGNLNVHFSIPLIHRAGRGMDFTYDLSYDNSIWYPATCPSGSGSCWTPVLNWGWRGVTEAATGFISSSAADGGIDGQGCNVFIYSFTYHDTFGVPHNFQQTVSIHLGGSNCIHTTFPRTLTTPDGSGYSVILSSVAAGTLYSRSGKVINAPFGSGSGAGTATDANGNQITINGSGQFFDTLSATSPVLTVAGTAPSPTTYTYTSPAGSKHYTMNYTQYSIATAFNCTGVGQYTGTAYLVSSIVLPDSTQYTFTYESTTGRLKTLKLPTGGTITYAYTGGDGNGITCADGSTSGLTRTLNPGGTWNYARSVSGSNWTTTVTTPPDPVNAGSASDVTTISFKKDGATNGTNDYYETQRVVNQGTSTVLSTSIVCYNGVNETNPSSCPITGVTSPISRRATFTYLPNASGQQAETLAIYLSGTDLPTDVYTYDFGSAAVGALLRHTQTAYATLGNDIIDHPSFVKVFDGGANLQAQTTYTYDEDINTLAASGATQHQGVTGSRGNLTTLATQANSTTTLYKKFTHYDTGMPVTSTDVSTSSTTNGATTTYTYASSASSCNFAFPTSLAEPLSLSRSMTWDCTGGVLLSTIDENGRTSSTAYSGSSYSNVFWRPYSATDQTGVTTNFTYPSATQTESTLTFNGGASVVDHVTTLDGFGRLSVSQTLDGASYDSVESTYDALGRATFVSLPYTAAKSALCSGCPGKTTGYDALGRVSSISDSGGGSATFTYPSNDVYLTVAAPSPENPKRRQFQYDGAGRLTSVCEITTPANGGGSCLQTSGQTGYWTTYAFNSLQTVVTQNAQSATHQTRTYKYDEMGRLVYEANPETKNVATNYTYDTDTTCTGGYPAGNLVKRIDAAGNVSCYTDDQLHRVTSIAYPSGPNSAATPTKHFVYDGATITVNGTPTTMANAKTRLAEAYTGTSKTTDLAYSYSNRGEVTDIYSSTPSSGGYYHLAKAYWENGALKSLGGIPSVPTISYGVDASGRISTASGGSQNPVTGTSYNSAGQVTGITFGSSDSDSYQYDPNTNRMNQYSFNVNGQSVIGKPTWNPNGTLKQFQVTQDPFNPANVQTCSYGYDDLARISSAGCGSVWAQTFTYDPFGNITKSGSSSWMPGYDETNNHYALGGTGLRHERKLDPGYFSHVSARCRRPSRCLRLDQLGV